MHNFFKSKLFTILVIITVIILALSILSTATRNKIPFISDAVGVITTPVQRFFRVMGHSTSNFFDSFRTLSQYRQENEELAKRISELEEKTREYYSVQSENERLRGLLSFSEEHPEYDTVGAEIVAKDTAVWYSSFTINKGTSSGIEKNDVVITEKGLVGYIYEVGTTWSKVISIVDSKSSLGGIIERTGDRAIVEGNVEYIDKGACKMTYLSKNATVTAGDFVETSGLGGIYPKGLLIGKIKDLKTDDQGLFYEAAIETAVDFERIDEVLVIRN